MQGKSPVTVIFALHFLIVYIKYASQLSRSGAKHLQ